MFNFPMWNQFYIRSPKVMSDKKSLASLWSQMELNNRISLRKDSFHPLLIAKATGRKFKLIILDKLNIFLDL